MADAPLWFRSVLVTGAGGFVGCALVRALAHRLPADARLTLCGRAPDRNADPALANATWMPMDVRAPEEVGAVIDMARPDLVIHLAALSSVAQSGAKAAETWDVNLGGSLTLARALVERADPITLLFASSADVYGDAFVNGPADEDSPLHPTSPYGRSKAAAEAMLADVLRADDRLIVVRPSNHSGPGQDERFVLPSFAAQIARAEAGIGPPRMQVGNLSAERDFMDVRDVVDAYLTVLSNSSALPYRTTLNVASGQPVAIGALLDMLLARAKIPIAIETDPARMRSSDIPRAELATRRLTALTDWRPRHAIANTLATVLDDVRARMLRPSNSVSESCDR